MNKMERMVLYHKMNDFLVSYRAIPEDVVIPEFVDEVQFERVRHLYEMFLDFKEKVLDAN
jgi:hypothetical protein